MNNLSGTKKDMEAMMKALNCYLESLGHIEVMYSEKRGYMILRWDAPSGRYYGIDLIENAGQLAMYIYGELIEQITVETKTDHNLKNMDFDALELDKARAVTKEFLHILPVEAREKISEKIDPKTGLLRFSMDSIKSLMG